MTRIDLKYETLLGDPKNLSRRAHLVEVFESRDRVIEGVCKYAFAGLTAGEGVVIVAKAEHNDAVQNYLVSLEIDVARAIKTGQVVFMDAVNTLELLMTGEHPDREKFFKVIGGLIDSKSKTYPLIRAYGEMVDILALEGNFEGAMELEALWNELAETRSFSLLCGYSACNFTKDHKGQRLSDVCRSHTHVVERRAV